MSSMLWKCSCSWERSMSIRWREFNTEPLKYHCQEEFSLQHRKVLTDTSPRARAKWQEGESSFGCTRHAIGESLGLKLFHIVSPKIRIMVHQEHWYCYYNSFSKLVNRVVELHGGSLLPNDNSQRSGLALRNRVRCYRRPEKSRLLLCFANLDVGLEQQVSKQTMKKSHFDQLDRKPCSHLSDHQDSALNLPTSRTTSRCFSRNVDGSNSKETKINLFLLDFEDLDTIFVGITKRSTSKHTFKLGDLVAWRGFFSSLLTFFFLRLFFFYKYLF
ncbi:unnamed protein product [Arabidopsis thaliana]|uniref:Uncharacterized protein n=1 Tax=Arabidopsis thaliana TaxID=3702 RepID=A0A5S9URT5_ARATH|nr:unnamed protein product [Arabidopsis thaliana]